MTHRIEVSAYEAKLLAKNGIVACCQNTEDSYGSRYYVNETPTVIKILYGDDMSSFEEDTPIFKNP